MGMLDFIFGGSSPPNAPATGGNRNIPQWMSDASMDYVNKVHAVANDPYQAYDAPRIAAPSSNETGAWDTIGGVAGKYDPAMQGALSTVSGVPASADTYYKPAAADISSGTGTFTGDTVNKYMNPYEGNVIQRGADLATRNFQENILPGLNSQFVGAGQFGSTPNAAVAYRGARDVTQNIQDTANTELAGAYDAARGAQGADASRAITAGTALSGLAGSRGALDINAGTAAGDLASTGSGMDLKAAAARDAAGQEQTGYNQKNLDLRYNDFQNQNNYDKNQLNWEGASLAGTPVQSGSFSQTDPSNYYDASPIGTGSSGAGLAGLLTGARGGVVKKPATDDDALPGWLHEAMKELMRAHRRGALSAA